jgi:hypothetical protein
MKPLAWHCALLLTIGLAVSVAQDTDWPKDERPASNTPQGGDPVGVRVTTMLEVFAMPRSMFLELLGGLKEPAKAQEAIETLRRRSQEPDATCRIQAQEAVTGVAGQEARSESIHELIYPTEYEADSGIPNDRKPPQIIAPTGKLLPTAFETRNVGSTLEVTPVLIHDGTLVAAKFSWEVVSFLGMRPYDGGVEQPKFSTQSIRSELVARPGETLFVGLVHPTQDDSLAPEADVVWAAFVRFIVTK